VPDAGGGSGGDEAREFLEALVVVYAEAVLHLAARGGRLGETPLCGSVEHAPGRVGETPLAASRAARRRRCRPLQSGRPDPVSSSGRRRTTKKERGVSSPFYLVLQLARTRKQDSTPCST
jgi:hypothetical protein